jgi:hypothetical protein
MFAHLDDHSVAADGSSPAAKLGANVRQPISEQTRGGDVRFAIDALVAM